MNSRAPPISRLSERVLVDIENAVMRFSRARKYTVGTDLRVQAMAVARCIQKAWTDPEHRLDHVRNLCTAIDDLKITMKLAEQIKAFGSFPEFEAVARLIHEIYRVITREYVYDNARQKLSAEWSAQPDLSNLEGDEGALLWPDAHDAIQGWIA